MIRNEDIECQSSGVYATGTGLHHDSDPPTTGMGFEQVNTHNTISASWQWH